MRKHLDIRAFGRVQGVFFRLAAKERALALGLAGLARNEPDGSVYLEVEGDESSVSQFLEWCRGGSADAWVKRLDVSDGQPRDLSGFLVR